MFPGRSPMRGPSGDSEMLNAPPPSPVQPLAPSAGMSGDLSGLAPMPVPSGLLPPEILTGLMQVASSIDQQLETFAQIAPDLAPEWMQIKDLLQQAMGKLLVAGATPASPTAPGPAFSGGGISRGGGPA